MMPERAWIPVALSHVIEAGTSAGALIDGAELVVWRDRKGTAHIWEDRCPHRGMRMSFGFVRGDHIACLYHGWQYDAAGQCRHIPAHPDLEVPATIRIATYAAEERNGIIWTCLAEDADIAGIPDAAGTATPVRSLYVDCSMETAAAALARASLPVEGGPDEPAAVAELLPGSWLLCAGATRIMIAAQPVNRGKIALHIVLIDAPGGSALPKAVARWAAALRLRLEAIPAPIATPEYA